VASTRNFLNRIDVDGAPVRVNRTLPLVGRRIVQFCGGYEARYFFCAENPIADLISKFLTRFHSCWISLRKLPKFKNFSIWRGRLPHWRADDVTYYVTFRHRRALDESERVALLRALMRPDTKRWDLLVVCVLPENTELIFTVREHVEGVKYELAQIVEKEKTRVGKQIIKKTGERFPPFYTESYDRIIRDQDELETRWREIIESPVNAELVESPGDYTGLHVSEAGLSAPSPQA